MVTLPPVDGDSADRGRVARVTACHSMLWLTGCSKIWRSVFPVVVVVEVRVIPARMTSCSLPDRAYAGGAGRESGGSRVHHGLERGGLGLEHVDGKARSRRARPRLPARRPRHQRVTAATPRIRRERHDGHRLQLAEAGPAQFQQHGNPALERLEPRIERSRSSQPGSPVARRRVPRRRDHRHAGRHERHGPAGEAIRAPAASTHGMRADRGMNRLHLQVMGVAIQGPDPAEAHLPGGARPAWRQGSAG